MKGSEFAEVYWVIIIILIAAVAITVILYLKGAFENTPDIFSAISRIFRFW